jgi:broad specificity phosphatase PhoE
MAMFEGWKAIAAALGRTKKTAQILADKHGLPVRVLINRVYMESADLDEWRRENDITYAEHRARRVAAAQAAQAA